MRERILTCFTIFVAELGDKTQPATLRFASARKVPARLEFAASAALW